MTLNRLRTGVGRFRNSMFRWGLSDSPACVCGESQTAQHIIHHCAVLGPAGDADLADINDDTRRWLQQLEGVT